VTATLSSPTAPVGHPISLQADAQASVLASCLALVPLGGGPPQNAAAVLATYRNGAAHRLPAGAHELVVLMPDAGSRVALLARQLKATSSSAPGAPLVFVRDQGALEPSQHSVYIPKRRVDQPKDAAAAAVTSEGPNYRAGQQSTGVGQRQSTTADIRGADGQRHPRGRGRGRGQGRSLVAASPTSRQQPLPATAPAGGSKPAVQPWTATPTDLDLLRAIVETAQLGADASAPIAQPVRGIPAAGVSGARDDRARKQLPLILDAVEQLHSSTTNVIASWLAPAAPPSNQMEEAIQSGTAAVPAGASGVEQASPGNLAVVDDYDYGHVPNEDQDMEDVNVGGNKLPGHERPGISDSVVRAGNPLACRTPVINTVSVIVVCCRGCVLPTLNMINASLHRPVVPRSREWGREGLSSPQTQPYGPWLTRWKQQALAGPGAGQRMQPLAVQPLYPWPMSMMAALTPLGPRGQVVMKKELLPTAGDCERACRCITYAKHGDMLELDIGRYGRVGGAFTNAGAHDTLPNGAHYAFFTVLIAWLVRYVWNSMGTSAMARVKMSSPPQNKLTMWRKMIQRRHNSRVGSRRQFYKLTRRGQWAGVADVARMALVYRQLAEIHRGPAATIGGGGRKRTKVNQGQYRMPPPQWRHWRQQGPTCQVHAINMLLQAEVCSVQALRECAQQLVPVAGDARILPLIMNDEGFSDDVVNTWARKTLHCTMVQEAQCEAQTSNANLLATLETLWQTTGATALLGRTPTHSFTLRRREQEGWVLLDSMRDAAVTLPTRSPTECLFPSTITLFRLAPVAQQAEVNLPNIELTPPFWQPQDRNMCLIHATNAVLGAAYLTAADALRSATAADAALRECARTLASRQGARPGAFDHCHLRNMFCPNTGNFAQSVFNHYLATTAPAVHGQRWRLHHVLHPQPRTLTEIAELVQGSGCQRGCLLASRNHATALVRGGLLGEWYLVDSLKPGPELLKPEWQTPPRPGHLVASAS
jgi:hypothetical protein